METDIDFSGTTEGRQLADMPRCIRDLRMSVSFTGYGHEVMTEGSTGIFTPEDLRKKK